MNPAGKSQRPLDERIFTGAVLLGGAVVVSVLLFQYLAGKRQASLREYHQVGNFQLTDSSGRVVKQTDLRGKIVVVDFFFGGCSEQCLMLGRQMGEVQRLTAGMKDVLLVSITVDPGSDTPPALARYAARINADTNRWLFLTGDRQIIYPLIQESFLLAVAEESGQTPSVTPGFIHSDKIALVDQRGIVRAYYDGMEARTPQLILAGIKQVLAEK